MLSDSEIQLNSTASTHVQDPQTLTLEDISQLDLVGDYDSYKQAIVFEAMPKDVLDYFAHADTSDIQKLTNQVAPINQVTGELELPAIFQSVAPGYVTDFLSSVALEFNKVGDWPCHFVINIDRGAHHAIIPKFHYDISQEERLTRCITSVSDCEEDQDHETEVLLTGDLSLELLREFYRDLAP